MHPLLCLSFYWMQELFVLLLAPNTLAWSTESPTSRNKTGESGNRNTHPEAGWWSLFPGRACVRLGEVVLGISMSPALVLIPFSSFLLRH